MVPAKEAKDMLYTLLSENLVQLQVQASHVKMLSPFLFSYQATELLNSNLIKLPKQSAHPLNCFQK